MCKPALLLALSFAFCLPVAARADEPPNAAPPTRKQLIEKAEALRQREIDELEVEIKDIKSGKTKIPLKQRKAKLAQLTARLGAVKKRAVEIAPLKFEVGSAGRIDHTLLSFKVERVVDSQSVVARVDCYVANVDERGTITNLRLNSSGRVLLRGIATDKLADDQRFNAPDLGYVSSVEEIGGERLRVIDALKD